MATRQEPQRYGKCVVEREVGRGARSTVYLAWHEGLHIPVAIKVMKKEGGADEELFSERFMREARIAAQLTHPNIVRVYDCGETEDSYYLVLEYIQGESCRDRMVQGEGFDWQSAVRIIREVADGLNHASKKGIIHRDLKPENIMIDNEGTARIADLGLAKEVGVRGSATADGDVLGTPYYMSPEQVRAPGEVDFRSDVYSLGATLYHMATNEVPFEAPTPFEIMTKHLNDPLIPPQEVRPDLPEALCDIIMRAMAKEPQNRYQTYRDLMRDLDVLLGGEPRAKDSVMLPVEETLAEAAEGEEAPEVEAAAGPPRAAPRPLRPIELPVTAHNVRAKAVGAMAVLAYVLFPVCLYHIVLSRAGPVAALAAFAVAVGGSLLWSYLVLHRSASVDQEHVADEVSERLSAAMGWVCERLDMPVPLLHVGARRDEECQVYGFFSRKAAIYIPGGWLERAALSDLELRAYLARNLAGVYNGDADIRTFLALPEALVGLVGNASRRLLERPRSLTPRGRLRLGRAVALVGLLALIMVVAVLFRVSILAGLLGLALGALLLLTSGFERYCVHAGDDFAVRVVGNADAVKSLVVVSGLTSLECHRLLRDSLGDEVADRGLDELPTGRKRRELFAAITDHYSAVAYVPDMFEMLGRCFAVMPSAAERLNRLAGLPLGSSPLLAGITAARRVYGAMLGDPARRMNVQDLGDVKPYAATGLTAGLMAVAAVTFLFIKGRDGYLDFLTVLVALGTALGFIVAQRSCRATVSPGRLAWDIAVTALAFCVAMMLGFCLTGWRAVTPLALQFIVALVAVMVPAALAGLLLVRAGPKVGIQMGSSTYERKERTHHTVVLDQEQRDSLLEGWRQRMAGGEAGKRDEG